MSRVLRWAATGHASLAVPNTLIGCERLAEREPTSGTMKFESGEPNGPIDTLLVSHCWPAGGDELYATVKMEASSNPAGAVLSAAGPGSNDDDGKVTLDVLDTLLMNGAAAAASGGGTNQQGHSLAELKPLPPFAGYTGHLSINGIPGHHFHAIGQPVVETNNNSSTTANQNTMYYVSTTSEQPVVSSTDQVKPEFVDYSTLLAPDIEDIAAIIGSAIADTTVPSSETLGPDPDQSRDSWMDLEAWIDTACSSEHKQGQTQHQQQSQQSVVSDQTFSANEFEVPSSTLQSLLTSQHSTNNAQNNYLQRRDYPQMPLLQNRLQNGPVIKAEPSGYLECPSPSSSTPHATSPPGMVSTTDRGFQRHRQPTSSGTNGGGVYPKPTSPDPLSLDGVLNYPTTTTNTPPNKKIRPRQRKGPSSGSVFDPSGVGGATGLLGKEKPVHRCTICNRGFLNKSNIKVHLRTHTGEKPFRCEVCGKAFRQKAHLIKHQQIHKRVGRD